MKKHIEENYKCYLIIIFIAIIITSGLLINGLPDGHDVDAHMARAVGTGKSLKRRTISSISNIEFCKWVWI